MANTRKFILEQVKDEDIIFINACSQCTSLAEIRFEGLDNSIVLKKTNSSSALQRLDGGFQAIRKGPAPLSLTITITGQTTPDKKMKVIQNTFIMANKNGKEQGINYVYNIEDVDDGDEDFNDYYINVVAWHRRG